jgi:hypothetical protein
MPPRWLESILLRAPVHGWRKIAITLTDPDFGEQTAQGCAIAWFRQLSRPLVLSVFGGCSGNGQWRDILYRFRLNQR